MRLPKKLDEAAAGFIERSRVGRYVFVAVTWPWTWVSDRVQRIHNPVDRGSLRRALVWARTGEYPTPPRDRPAAARVTTPAERAPTYAAYRAARAYERETGAHYDDDGIIQAAIKAYETAEMARLRAQVRAALAFADDLDNSGQQPTLLAIRLREAIWAAAPDTEGDDVD